MCLHAFFVGVTTISHLDGGDPLIVLGWVLKLSSGIIKTNLQYTTLTDGTIFF